MHRVGLLATPGALSPIGRTPQLPPVKTDGLSWEGVLMRLQPFRFNAHKRLLASSLIRTGRLIRSLPIVCRETESPATFVGSLPSSRGTCL